MPLDAGTYSLAQADALYDMARTSDGPWQPAKPLPVKAVAESYIHTWDGRHLLDLDSQILAYAFGSLREAIPEAIQVALGDSGITILGPHSTHPAMDAAQVALQQAFEQAGWGDYEIAFQSSGTRANENALRAGRAELEGAMHPLLLREAYHGAGLLNALINHPGWRGMSTIPLGMPVTFVPFEKPAPFLEGRNYLPGFEDALHTDVAASARPYLMAEAGVQGVAGFRKINPEKLQQMAIETHKRGGLVHYDVVQTMPGRTAGEDIFTLDGLVDPRNEDTIPDIVVGAKGCGGWGHALAFVAFKTNSFDRSKADFMARMAKDYDTYGRNVPAAIAFHEVLKRVQTEGFMKDVTASSRQWDKGLFTLFQTYPGLVSGVTGAGMMRGFEFHDAMQLAQFRNIGAAQTGFVCGAGGIKGNVARFGHRIDAPVGVIDEALNRIEDTLKEMEA